MGWSSGNSIMSKIMDTVTENVRSKKARKKIYEDLIPVFDGEDWDGIDEHLGQDEAFDEAAAALGKDVE